MNGLEVQLSSMLIPMFRFSAVRLFERRIDYASVVVKDLNGTKGGIDKSCQLAVHVKGLGSIHARPQPMMTQYCSG